MSRQTRNSVIDALVISHRTSAKLIESALDEWRNTVKQLFRPALIIALLAILALAGRFVLQRSDDWGVPQISDSPTPPIFVPPANEVLVANFGGDSIVGFAIQQNGSVDSSPARIIAGNNTGIDDPVAVAINSSGDIVVLNSGVTLGNPGILIFSSSAHGNVAPAQTITDPMFVNPQGFAYVGNSIWVANWVTPPDPLNSSAILRLQSGQPPATRLLNTAPPNDLSYRSGGRYAYIPVAPDDEVLILQDTTFSGVASPYATLSGSSTLLDQPMRAAVDGNNAFYVVNRGNYTINIYDPLPLSSGGVLDVPPVNRLRPGPQYRISNPLGIAVTPGGRLFVGDGNRLLVLDRSGSTIIFGQEILSSTVSVPGSSVARNSLNTPYGIALRCAPPSCPSPP